MTGLLHSHAHLDAPEFDGDRTRALHDARAAGVNEMVIPAVSAATWRKLRGLCGSEPGLYPAYGLRPCYRAQHEDRDLVLLKDWLRTHPAVTVGECGLDHFEPGPDRDRQLRLLHGQFEIAHRFDLPLALQARRACGASSRPFQPKACRWKPTRPTSRARAIAASATNRPF